MSRTPRHQLILSSEALALCETFGQIAVGTLRIAGTTKPVGIAEGDVAELKSRIGSMSAHPEAAPTLTQLRDEGLRLVTLTNSASQPPIPLELAGLVQFFEKTFSVERVGRFKPAPETYRLVADEFGVGTDGLYTIGAQAAGCSAALVTHPGNALRPAEGVPVPDLAAPTLTELAEQIALKWPRRA